MAITGVAGAKLFEHFKMMPDLIYIDGDMSMSRCCLR
jgi:hypothetical protein